MAKKLKTLVLCIGDSDRWVNVDLDNCDGEAGYFLGSVQLSFDEGVSASFHVEAVEINQIQDDGPFGKILVAQNSLYQNRLDNYFAKNEGSVPHLVRKGRKKYFIHIEPYAD